MRGLLKSILLILIFLSGACKKSDEEATPFRASFTATINNVQFSFAQSDDYRLAGGAGIAFNIIGTDTADFVIQSGLINVCYAPDTIIKNSIYVLFVQHIPMDSLTPPPAVIPLPERIFRRVFTVGNYNYTYLPLEKGGVMATWYDGQGNRWASGRDVSWEMIPPFRPDYSSNTFSIVYSKPLSFQAGINNYQQEVHLVFNCWVYNSKGDSLHIENATLKTIYTY